MRSSTIGSGIGAAVAAITLLGPEAGHAAAAAASTEPAATPTVQLQEVIVTAQKFRQNLQKTAVSVTAVSGQALQKAGVLDPQGLTDLVPGVEAANTNSNTTFTIRGISSTTDATLGDAAVAFHLDGVFEGRPSAASGLFYDLSRVEVLRGPQGTLYGRNATAGTVNVIPNHPELNEFQGDAQVETGNYGELRTEGMLNAPISDTFAVRASFQSLRHNGYLNSGYDDADDHAARLQTLWQPNEDFSLLLYGDYFHQGGVGNGFTQLPYGSNPWDTQLPLITQSNYVSPVGTTDNTSWTVHATLTWQIGDVVLTEIPAFHHLTVNYFAYGNGLDNQQYDQERETSNELRLSSVASAAVKWVAGLYYHDEEQPYWQAFYDNAQPQNPDCCTYLGEGDSLHFIYPKISNPSYAAFGQLTFPVTSSFRVTGGVRWNRDHKRVIGGTYKFFGEDTVPFFGPTIPAGTQQLSVGTDADATWQKVTWKAGVEKDLGEQHMLYGNVSTGYKQGGVFAGAPPNTYKPESITAYEIGFKNRFLDNRVQINGDVFYYNYRDMQVDQLEDLPLPGGGYSFGDDIFNAARATEYGGEIETSWLITGADELQLNIAGLHARFGTFLFPLQANPPHGGVANPVTFEDLTGQTPTSAPKWTATLIYQHTWDLNGGSSLEWRLQTHLETSYWLAVDHAFDPNKAGSHQGGYSRTGSEITWTAPDQKYFTRLWVQNVENKAVMTTYSYGGSPPAYASISAPRTFGVTVGAKW